MKIPPELQTQMYEMLRRFRHHNPGEGHRICPMSPDYIQYAEERGPCDCGADDVQKLLARIEDCLRTEQTTYGGLA
jgi:hypothetical protein